MVTLMSKQPPVKTDDETPANREHAAAGSAKDDKASAAVDGLVVKTPEIGGAPTDSSEEIAPATDGGGDQAPAEGVLEQASEPIPEAVSDEGMQADEIGHPKSQHVAHEQLVIEPALLVESEEPLDFAVLEDVALAVAPQEGPEPRGDNDIFLPHDLIAFGPLSFGQPSHARGGKKQGGGGGGNDDDSGDGPVVLSSYTSGGAAQDSYNITIKFKGGDWTGELQQAFIDASNWISGTIEEDVANVRFRGKFIDDIQIDATVKSIDGTGGVLGQAGPTAIRYAEYDYLPAKAVMTFDTADAQDLLSGSFAGTWDAVVLHEMLHSVGVGTIWDLQGLVSGSGTSTPTFTGDQTVLAYDHLFDGEGYVPLESGYGPGTDESHWDEFVFGNELMTGFIDIGPSGNYVSGMTVASLADIGYVIDSGSYSQQVEHVV
jgi:hypothetical protein